MRRRVVWPITLLAATASAHVAPSVDDNNRYLKLTPQGDRVRLAYTVFFGENPGLQTRPGMDTDHDGAISEAESRTFGGKLAGEVAAQLDVVVDGKAQTIGWTDVAVGLGSPQVRAGSFSVDMIAYLCLPSAGGHHTVLLRDRFRIARPGETELRVEDSPGVTIASARIGALTDASHDYKFVGPGGPLADDGLELVFDAGDKALRGGTCGPVVPAPAHGIPAVFVACAAAVVGLGAAIGFVMIKKRKGDA